MFETISEKNCLSFGLFYIKLNLNFCYCEWELHKKMKLVEAWKVLSSFFSTGNQYLQLQERTLNHKSVS